MIEITRTIEWEMGHRIPNHDGKCKNPHGHRYRLELTIGGKLISTPQASDEGMVMDFGDINAILFENIHKYLDHSFMVSDTDSLFVDFAETAKDLKFLVVPFIPTAENILCLCHDKLKDKLPKHIKVSRLRLYETPHTWVDLCP